MKKLLITLTLATTLPLPVQANDTPSALEFCKPIHRLAERIMEHRQEGTSMVKMLEIANSSEGTAKSVVILMIEEAYNSTRYRSPENQRRAVQDFGNENFKLCIDVMKENEK